MIEKGFPQDREKYLLEKMKGGGQASVISYIVGYPDWKKRLQLFQFAHQLFSYGDWEGKNLDSIISIVEEGINEALRISLESCDDGQRMKMLDFANVMSYNLAADLAPCWPGDNLQRSEEHFRTGVKTSLQCIAWRYELEKGPGPLASAYWALGIHLLSLGFVTQSEQAFTVYMTWAKKEAQENGAPAEPCIETTFQVLLAEGCLGLAEIASGRGNDRYIKALDLFRKGAGDRPDMKGDFDFGVGQLEEARKRILDT